MKTRIYIFICIILGLTSCNDWLDIELEDKVDEKKLYSTVEGFRESLAGVYVSMADSVMYGSVLTLEYVDLMGQYYQYSGIQNRYEYFKDFDYKNSGVKAIISQVWNRMYKCIAQANNIIEWTDRNADVLTEAERNQIRGEAIGLRAYLHFDLYRLFSPDAKRSPEARAIPYNKNFGVTLPPMYTTQEVLQLIIDDIKDAEALLAEDPINDVVPYQMETRDDADKYVARINRWTLKAMLARAYQARGDYDNAIAAAREVIESGKFRMLEFSDVDGGESQRDALFSSEHIFSLRNQNMKRINQYLFRDVALGAGSHSPTALPFVSYSALCEGNNDDARLSTWYPEDFMKYFYDNSELFFRKMPMIKLSEMYLIIAECSYEDDPATTLSYLNQLRNKRIRNNMPLQYISRETIIQEMRREYIGEGQMWYAFKRNNATITSDRPTGNIQPSDEIYVWPLPDSEIEDGFREQ